MSLSNRRLSLASLGCLLLWLVSFPIKGVEQANGELDENNAVALDDRGAGTEAGNYEERVRQMQEWMRQRRMEREGGWARELVSPRPQSADAEDQEENPDEEEEADGDSGYFAGQGLDERGYRRLDGNLRVRIRGLQGEPAHVISVGRHGRGKADRTSENGRSSVRAKSKLSRHGKASAVREPDDVIQLKAGKSSSRLNKGTNATLRGSLSKSPVVSKGRGKHEAATAPARNQVVKQAPKAAKKAGAKKNKRR